MSQVQIRCPSCQSALAVNYPWAAGAAVLCPRCQNQIDLPDSRRFAASAKESIDPFSNSGGIPAAARPVRRPQLQPASARDARYDEASEAVGSSKLLFLAIGGGGTVGVIIVIVMIAIMTLRSNNASQPAPPPVAAIPAAREAAPAQQLQPGAVTSAPGAAPQPAQPGATATASTAAPNNTPSVPPATTPTASVGSPISTAASQPPQTALPAIVSPSATEGSLAYRWNPGEDYAYFIKVKAEVAGVQDESSGMITIKASSQPASVSQSVVLKQGSGSGFVVSSDGYVVTCAHVVEGAAKIEVLVAGQNFAGQVVAIDKPHDLAIVRVQASNLPTVPLANSDSVQLAQEVRAVGFPLSDVLGESVKITRGTVAGMVNHGGRKLFQVDASINPGNSGGPLINEMGEVVGVASAKLAGEEIDGVGFAAVSNDVLNLLNSHRVPFRQASAGARLEGPELARQVTPAVAMLKVAIGAGGAGTGRRQALEFNGHVTALRTAGPNGRRLTTTLPRPEFESGKLVATEFGEVVESSGNLQLPYLLGALAPLTIEPLSASGERSWRTERAVALTQTTGGDDAPQMPFNFRRRGMRSPFSSPKTTVTITPAMETASYEILQSTGDLWLIKKRYQFKTLQNQGAAPLAEITGEGTITFNKTGGFAEKCEYQANLVRSSGGARLTIPVSLAWNRASAEQLADIKRRADELTRQRKDAEAKASQPPTQDELAQLLADVGDSGNFSRRYNALNALKKKQPVDSLRAQVTEAAEPLMLDSNSSIRRAAIDVMGAWGTKENIPALVKLLDQLDSQIRMATIEALGKIKDPASAAALAPLMSNQSDRHNAARALEALGEVAEPATIKLLYHPDNQVRYQACRIVGKIGRNRSVAALKKMAQTEKDGFVRAGAQGALKDLQKRGVVKSH